MGSEVVAPGPWLGQGEVPTVWELVSRRAALTPDAPCLVDERGRRLTFDGYRRRCEAVAAGLAAEGVGEGTVVSWQLPTSLEAIVLSGALARLGAVQVPVLPTYRQRELALVLGQVRPAVVFVPPASGDRDLPAEHAAIAGPLGGEVVVVDGELPHGDPAQLGPVPAPARAVEVPTRWIYYTSGTGAAPKGARHTDDHLVLAARALVDSLDLGPDDVAAIVFPYAHVGGSFLFLSGILAGHRHVVVTRFDAAAIELLRDEGVTYAGSGLAFQRAYLDAQRRRPDRPLFPRVRGFPHGGDAKRPPVHQALVAEIGGVGVLSNYGMTEVPMVASGRPDDPPEKLLERIGRPCRDVRVRIVGFDGHPRAPGEEGEIRVQAPTMLTGYVDAALDATAFDGEGYFRTGDLGFLDADGYLEVTGRLKDVIIRKGENISAQEVEDVLHEHPGVIEVAVVGLPDEERGERCCAVIVPAPGHGLDLASIGAFLRDQGLMAQKWPEQLELRAQLPRDFLGKVQKAELRRSLAEADAAPASAPTHP